MKHTFPIVAVDPGTLQSAFVVFDGQRVLSHGIQENDLLLDRFRCGTWEGVQYYGVVFESIQSYGMPVGREVFDTVFWTGRFYELATHRVGADRWGVSRVPRRDIKLHLCGNPRAKDANIRQALLDLFGGRDGAVGRKAAPGPLYGIKSHEWAALALAVTWWHDLQMKPRVRA